MSSATPPQTPSSSDPSEPLPSTTVSQPLSSSASESMASTSSQTPSSSVSTSSPTRWDVFLSFRGQDTRNNFTSHLYDKLVCNGLRTFKDDPELHSGEVISDALVRAIQESKAYVVVFSENYATSPWCLSELVEIFNCHKTAERLVIPVFYKIDPSVVRHQTGSFEKAFVKHQLRFEMEKLSNWRLTLNQVAHLSGVHICGNRSEADIINEIVDEILPKLNPKVLDVAEYAVGLDSRVKDIIALLSGKTEEGFTKIGLYGMGGVGKTTLAKALYNQLLVGGNFSGSCFLANVREISGTTNGMVSLQEQLINNVLKSKEKFKVHNVEEGMKSIRERVCLSKVLLLIDDIDDSKQFKSLAGQFVSGSVVILTTRDEEILDKIDVESRYRYKVHELNDAESLVLFTQHAFRNAEQDNTLMQLSTDILRHADGLPLALEVFGSYLYNQSEVGWNYYIKKLRKVPNSTIQQKLIISLDAIELDDPMLKKIFLDIACFFIGWDKEEVVKIMETYYDFADHKIDILKKRCLVKFHSDVYSGKHKLNMHDLLRDMGREIVRNISHVEPGRQSRLWASQEIYDVLKDNKGTEAIEGIIPDNFSYKLAIEGKSFTTETFETIRSGTFKKMTKLRFLSLTCVNVTGSFEQTFEDLRWFCWELCPLKCLPTEFYPQKLEILLLLRSDMRTMWEPNMVPHVFGNLKALNMAYSKNLVATPDFTKLPCLVTLILRGCRSLEEVHISIGYLMKLQSIDLQECVKLRSLPETICNLRALTVLNISMCRSLEALPIQLGHIESLTKLDAYGLTVSKLPDSIGSLTKLVELHLTNNKNLETLPDTICKLRSLEILRINGCEELETLPDQLWEITRLTELDASFADMLGKLPDIGSSQIELSLQILNLCGSDISALPSGFSLLINLKKLNLKNCLHLFSIPKLPPNLKQISAYGCSFLERLPNLSNLKHLETLDLTYCEALTEILGLEELTALRELFLRGCSGLTYIQGLEDLASIRELRVEGLDNSCNLTKRLLQIYSELGHQITVSVYTPLLGYRKSHPQWPDWIMGSPYWTSESESNTVYAHLLPNESKNFMAIILCFGSHPDCLPSKISYLVKNTSSGFTWSDSLCVPFMSENLMLIVPKSIFSVTDNDHRIEISANIKILGIHLLYKTETKMIEDAGKKYVICVDALKLVDPVLQNIFLDITCFFLGWRKEAVVRILETYYSNMDHNIDILKNRSLLRINDWDELEMDDRLQHIGKKIAHNNSPDEPEKHSRLWLSIDIYEVFKKRKGAEVIEGIVPRKSYSENALEGESFSLETFKEMRKLRFLYLKKVHLIGSFEQTFENLRWLWWDFCPLKCLPSEFCPPKLVILELPHSNIVTMWELNMASHVFEKLKTLNISYSQDLTTTPDFTKLPCLETLNLAGCESLNEVHISIGSLVRLVSLDLHGCVKLRSLPNTICNLRALKVLNIGQCSNLEALPSEFGDMESLTKLNACGLSVSKLPKSIQRLSKLVELNLSCSKYLQTLPHNFCNLKALEVLDVSDCTCLLGLPTALGNVQSLRELNAENLTVLNLPDSIGHLSKLVELRLSGSKNLENLPVTICNLISLEILEISGCKKLKILPDQLCKVTSLRVLIVNGATLLKRLPYIESCQVALSLRKLDFAESILTTLPSGIGHLSNLEDLNLKECRHLLSVPELPHNLKCIRADGCMSMTRLPNLSNFKQLEYLNLQNCSGLTEIRGLEGLASIRRLHLEGCNSFLVDDIFTESFFQMYSKFGHPIQISSTEFPVWISDESSLFWWSTLSLDLPPNMSCHFLGMIFCFTPYLSTNYSVKNIKSDFVWRGSFDISGRRTSLMEIVPRSIFPIEDGDERIELISENEETYGIHLLYKAEKHNSTTARED